MYMLKQLVKRSLSLLGYRLIPESMTYLDWRRKLLICLESWPSQGLVFLDVGANIGQTSIAVHKALSPETRLTCHCFEPFAETFKLMTEQIIPFSRVHGHRLAMGANPGSMDIALAPDSEWNSIANAHSWEGNGLGRERIELSTLDQFMAGRLMEERVILKTDTEGYDLEVLKGARGLLESGSVSVVIVEVGFNEDDKQHTYFQGVFDYLIGLGYRFVLLDDQRAYRDPIWNQSLALGFANAWFVHAKT
jgi:FkbM family methyltransferase